MDLSIVAVFINNPHQTERFVSSVRDHTKGRYELILIDNGSTNQEAIDYAKHHADTYVRFDRRVDLAKAWNRGIGFSQGKFVAVCNNDIVVPRHWFAPLKETLEKKKAGLVSPLTVSILDYQFGRGLLKSLKKPFRIERWRQGVWGECNIYPRHVLKDVGGFCEDYKEASAEDLDLLYTLHEKDCPVYVDPRVFVFHEGSATANAIYSPKEFEDRWERNWQQFLQKWAKHKKDILR